MHHISHPIEHTPFTQEKTGRAEGKKTITKRDTKADFIHLTARSKSLGGERRSTLLSSLYFRIASELIHNGFAGPRVLGGAGRSKQGIEWGEGRQRGDRNVSLEVTPAKLKVSGIAGACRFNKMDRISIYPRHPPPPFLMHCSCKGGGANESGAEEYTL